MSHPELLTEPVPPTPFSSYSAPIVVALGQDALGAALVQDQVDELNRRFLSDDAERYADYWRALQDFHDISAFRASRMRLPNLAAHYNFSEANTDHMYDTDGAPLSRQLKVAAAQATVTEPDAMAAQLQADILKLRSELRDQLKANPAVREMLKAYLEGPATELPAIFQTWREAAATGVRLPSWYLWLAEKATPDQFMNFLQWHNARTHQRNNDPELQAQISSQKRHYGRVLARFIAKGWLPATQKQTTSLKDMPVFIGDVFNTAMQDTLGYYSPEDDCVVIAPNQITNCAAHEFLHATYGGFSDRWLDEAVTEHIAVAMRNGAMKPIADYIDEGSYPAERLLLSLVMSRPGYLIDDATLLDGYTEELWYPDAPNSFGQAVDDAWGVGAMAKIRQVIQAYEVHYKAEGLREFPAQTKAVEFVIKGLREDPPRVFGLGHTLPKERQVA